MKEIELNHGKVAQVDDEDYERLNKHKWYAHEQCYTYYALRTRNKTNICMHREILSVPLGMEMDHRDMNGLNNQKYNLRICTKSQNQANIKPRRGSSSKFKGVSKTRRKWKAEIQIRGQRIYLGRFEIERDAALAYNDAAIRYFGEFARPNISNLYDVEGMLETIKELQQ